MAPRRKAQAAAEEVAPVEDGGASAEAVEPEPEPAPEPEAEEPKAGRGRVKARVLFTTVGWMEEGEPRPHYADHDAVISLPKSEFERLAALGGVEKA